jgi:hypothetical protein
MSVTRVLVIETPLSRAEVMKNTRAAEVIFKKFKKEKILNSYKFIDAGDRWLLITDFDSKTKMNKFVKALASTRREKINEPGGQFWQYVGPVKASG